MASSTITRHMDIVVKSIECYNMMVLDRNCHLHVPVAVIEEELTVAVGGTVNMEATTIDFTNSTIDFAGATINNFTGNIGGNISFTGNLNVTILTAQDIYGGTYHGNVIGPVIGDVCGNITTSLITEKNPGEGIVVVGDLYLQNNLIADLIGNVVGTFTGNANGTFNGVSNGTFNGVGNGDFFGNFCGNVITDALLPKTIGGDIGVFGNLVIEQPFMLMGDACIPNLTVANIFPKDPNVPIMIDGNIDVNTITAENLYVSGLLTTVTFGTSMVVSPMGSFSSLKVDTIQQNSIAGITFLDSVTFNANILAGNIVADQLLANVVCGNDVIAERLLPKSPLTEITVLADLDASGQTIMAADVCANLIETDRIQAKHFGVVTFGGNLIFDGGDYLYADQLQSQQLLVDQIAEYTIGGAGVNIANDTTVTGNLSASNTISAVTVGGQYLIALLNLSVLSTSNQITLGTSNTITINAPTPTGSWVYTLDDVLANASFVMTEGNQTINGIKTFTTPITATSGGTGTSTYSFGDLLYASSPTTLSTIPFGTSNQLLGIDGAASNFEYKTLTAGTGISISYPSPGVVLIDAGLAGVSSFSAGTTGFTPNVPTAGAVVLGGTLNVANGGTGLTATPTNGQLLIGNGAGYTLSTLTAGTGISVTNASGSITVTNTGVISLTAGSGVSVSASTGSITITNVGVSSFSAGTTGLTPNSPTTGAIVLGGVLSVANGGTNSSTTLLNDRIMVSNSGSIVEAAALTNGQLLIGSTGTAPVAANISGTVNQILVANGAGTITLSTPQDIHTAATPTFQSLTLTAATTQLVFGGGPQTITLTAPAPTSSLIYTVPDALTNAAFVMTEGNQTLNGVNTFTNTANFDADVVIGTNTTDTLTVNAKLSASGINGFTSSSFVGIFFDADQESIAAGVGGPISTTCYFTDLSVGAVDDNYTLANGTMNGQIKMIQLIDTAGGQAIITPTSLIGGTTITLPVSGGEVTLLWNGTGWRAIKRVTLLAATPLPFVA